MPNTHLRLALSFALVAVAQLGCQEQRDDAQRAVAAVKVLADFAQQGKVAEKAAAAAEKVARAQLADGTDPALAKQQIEMAKGLAAAKAMVGGGPAINWRELAPLLPDALGDYEAKGEIDGSTKKMAGFEVSEVTRRYEAGERELQLQITDASANTLIRAPFAMIGMIEEDSSQGFKKGKRIADQPAIVEWREKSKQSTAALLVAERFVVSVRVRKAQSDSEAETIALALKLDQLAKLATVPVPAAGAK